MCLKRIMKTHIWVGLGFLAVVSVALLSQIGSVTEVTTKIEKEVVVQEHPDNYLLEDEDARKAAEAVIRKKELEAELEQLESQRGELDSRITEIEKELGTYWSDKENVKALIRATFPEDPHTALMVANCESGLNPNAYNPHNNDGSTDGGLWQINSVHIKRMNELGLDRWNPEDATKYARMLYDEQGWNPWVCFWHPDHLAMR